MYRLIVNRRYMSSDDAVEDQLASAQRILIDSGNRFALIAVRAPSGGETGRILGNQCCLGDRLFDVHGTLTCHASMYPTFRLDRAHFGRSADHALSSAANQSTCVIAGGQSFRVLNQIVCGRGGVRRVRNRRWWGVGRTGR